MDLAAARAVAGSVAAVAVDVRAAAVAGVAIAAAAAVAIAVHAGKRFSSRDAGAKPAFRFFAATTQNTRGSSNTSG